MDLTHISEQRGTVRDIADEQMCFVYDFTNIIHSTVLFTVPNIDAAWSMDFIWVLKLRINAFPDKPFCFAQ